MNAQNIVLAGLSYGTKKPPMHLLLKPIMKKLRRLHTLGVPIETPNGLITYWAKIEMGIFDLPAKATVLSAKQFNGRYGCSVCLHPGEHTGRSRLYHPTEYPERTHRSVQSAARLAEVKGDAVFGIKGVSPLSKSLDVVDSIPTCMRVWKECHVISLSAGLHPSIIPVPTISVVSLKQLIRSCLQLPHKLSRPLALFRNI